MPVESLSLTSNIRLRLNTTSASSIMPATRTRSPGRIVPSWRSVLRSSIVSIESSNTSFMPKGLEAELSLRAMSAEAA